MVRQVRQNGIHYERVRIKKKVSYLISVDVLLRVIEPRAAQLLILRLLIH